MKKALLAVALAVVAVGCGGAGANTMLVPAGPDPTQVSCEQVRGDADAATSPAARDEVEASAPDCFGP